MGNSVLEKEMYMVPTCSPTARVSTGSSDSRGSSLRSLLTLVTTWVSTSSGLAPVRTWAEITLSPRVLLEVR